MPGAYDAILFDFDGVLVDSEPVHWRSWRDVLAPLGIGLSWEHYSSHYIGVSDDQTGRLIGAPPETLLAKRAMFRRLSIETPLVSAEVQRWLGALPLPLAVVTSSSQVDVDPILHHCGIYDRFAGRVYRESVIHLKPNPEPYRTAAALLNAARPLVVEDSAPGEASAHAAGFECLRIGSQLELIPAVSARLPRFG